jgi:hypothetical protein
VAEELLAKRIPAASAAYVAATERVAALRARHPRFIYNSFEGSPHGGDGMVVRFNFRLDGKGTEPGIQFAPEITFEGLDKQRLKALSTSVLENFLFHLGLVEMLSYWKAACSPEIVIETPEDVPVCALNDEQIAWWSELLRRGMGEFFYVNKINWRAPGFVRITSGPRQKSVDEGWMLRSYLHRPAAGDPAHVFSLESNRGSRDLVLTSGGKDSVVTLETLRAAGRPFDCLLLNPTQAALDVARQAGCDNPISVRRTIDPRLLELNEAGYLNGHTPFSALLAFLGVTVAALFGHRRVIVSNERSAEEATVEYLGEPINHQYSKTLQFETAFREYAAKYLAPEVEYFSLLRPLYELQIARMFARYPAYFPLFRSCNRGSKANAWCGGCAKCMFVYTVLYPFVKREQVLAIFGRDLFEWEVAAETLRALLGMDREKPFECVGTSEETLAAIYLCVERMKQRALPLPPALEELERTTLSSRNDLPQLVRRILSAWSEDHHVPVQLADVIRRSNE